MGVGQAVTGGVAKFNRKCNTMVNRKSDYAVAFTFSEWVKRPP